MILVLKNVKFILISIEETNESKQEHWMMISNTLGYFSRMPQPDSCLAFWKPPPSFKRTPTPGSLPLFPSWDFPPRTQVTVHCILFHLMMVTWCPTQLLYVSFGKLPSTSTIMLLHLLWAKPTLALPGVSDIIPTRPWDMYHYPHLTAVEVDAYCCRHERSPHADHSFLFALTQLGMGSAVLTTKPQWMDGIKVYLFTPPSAGLLALLHLWPSLSGICDLWHQGWKQRWIHPAFNNPCLEVCSILL